MNILISGASTGIGRACAVHLAEKGHTVWAGVRSSQSFDELASLKIEGLIPVLLDVTVEDSVLQCVNRVMETSKTLDAVVNNAGIARGGPIEAIELADWRQQFETNVIGAISLTRACLPHLRQTKGRVVNMSSISGRVAIPFMGPYSASKFALESISDCLRREMRRFGVHVAVVEPGSIDTPIWHKAKNEGMERTTHYAKPLMDVYGRSLEKFARRLEQNAREAAPVSVVVEAVEHALTALHPRTRYPVGRGTRMSVLLTRLLPDRWLDRMF